MVYSKTCNHCLEANNTARFRVGTSPVMKLRKSAHLDYGLNREVPHFKEHLLDTTGGEINKIVYTIQKVPLL